MRTCAICASPAHQGSMEPLGKNNALVFVCAACASETPRAWVREQGYEATGGLPSSGEGTAAGRRTSPREWNFTPPCDKAAEDWKRARAIGAEGTGRRKKEKKAL